MRKAAAGLAAATILSIIGLATTNTSPAPSPTHAVAFCCLLFNGEPELPIALHRGLTGSLREFTDQDGTHLTEAA